MALIFEGEAASAPLVNNAISLIVQIREAREAIEALTQEELEKTYWELLGAMVLSAETNANSPGAEDGKLAHWYLELDAAAIVSSFLVETINQHQSEPPRSEQLYEEAQGIYTAEQLAASNFVFNGSVVEDLF